MTPIGRVENTVVKKKDTAWGENVPVSDRILTVRGLDAVDCTSPAGRQEKEAG